MDCNDLIGKVEGAAKEAIEKLAKDYKDAKDKKDAKSEAAILKTAKDLAEKLGGALGGELFGKAAGVAALLGQAIGGAVAGVVKAGFDAVLENSTEVAKVNLLGPPDPLPKEPDVGKYYNYAVAVLVFVETEKNKDCGPDKDATFEFTIEFMNADGTVSKADTLTVKGAVVTGGYFGAKTKTVRKDPKLAAGWKVEFQCKSDNCQKTIDPNPPQVCFKINFPEFTDDKGKKHTVVVYTAYVYTKATCTPEG